MELIQVSNPLRFDENENFVEFACPCFVVSNPLRFDENATQIKAVHKTAEFLIHFGLMRTVYMGVIKPRIFLFLIHFGLMRTLIQSNGQ